MLTPNFDLSQNEEFLIISIQLPYAKISDIEVQFEDTDFMFYLKPYYLRLNLPGNVLYTAEPCMDYDVDKKILTIKAKKAERGQVFEGLDLITKLLAPKKSKVSTTPMIEVIDGLDTSQEEEELDWNIEQTPCEELNSINIHGDQCGFANSYSYAVFNLKEETREIFDIRDPQSKAPNIRREERLKTESEHFDEDHYIADLYEDEEIQQLLNYHPEWDILYDKLQADSAVKSPDDLIQFTFEEKDRLRKLPNKEYILDKHQRRMAFFGLIDIIFAYAYNKRTTMGDNTVESGWTVNKLSATLSWLESYSSVSEVAVASIRRSLCYPLFRHFELSVTILDDVRKIFLLGRKYVIKCLLEIHEMFALSEPRYILNDLFITDYCVWMQQRKGCSSDDLVPIASALEKVLLTKGDVGFNLVDLESFAAIAWMRHNQSAKELPNPVNKDKSTTAVEKGETSQAPEDDLCTNMENLSFQRKQSDDVEGCSNGIGNSNSLCNDLFSEYETCSSCTSGSSCSSSSYTCESDSDSYSDEDSSSSSDSEDSDSSSDSDDGAHRHLLKKENGEKNR